MVDSFRGGHGIIERWPYSNRHRVGATAIIVTGYVFPAKQKPEHNHTMGWMFHL